MNHAIDVAAAAYTALLRLYPRGFREEFGASMAEDFRETSQEIASVEGPRGLILQWIRATGDLLVSLVCQWGRLPLWWITLLAAGAATLTLKATLLLPLHVFHVRSATPDEEGTLLFLIVLTALFPVFAVVTFSWWFLMPAMRRRPGRRRA